VFRASLQLPTDRKQQAFAERPEFHAGGASKKLGIQFEFELD
jgi:hypothetical protein